MLQHTQEKVWDAAIILVNSGFPISACGLKCTSAKPNMFGEILYQKCANFNLIVDWQPTFSYIVLEFRYLYVSEVGHAVEAVGCISPVHVRTETCYPRITYIYCIVPWLIFLVWIQEILQFGFRAAFIEYLWFWKAFIKGRGRLLLIAVSNLGKTIAVNLWCAN